jgi:CysZ protein
LRRERSLWLLALLPLLLSCVAFGVALGLVVAYAAELYGFATAWLPGLEVERWYEWLWLGPAKALLVALGAALFLALAGAALVAAYLVASLLASPVHDALAARVEQIVTGSPPAPTAPGLAGALRDGLRAAREELRRLLFFLALTLPLVLLGALVPGAALLTGPLLVALTVFFLPLEYASYTLDRRRLSFAEKRRWLLAHRGVALGFGSAAFLVCTVPGMSLLAMPVLVVAGTLLALRLPPPPGAGRAAAG